MLYVRAPRLFEEFNLCHADGSFRKRLAAIAKISVLIIDDFAIAPIGAYFAQGRPSFHGKPVQGFTPCRSTGHEAGRFEIIVTDDRSSIAYFDISRLTDQSRDARRGAGRLDGFGTHGFELTHRVAAQLEVVSVVDQPIEDGVGECGIVDVGMPLFDVELAGDDRGGAVVAIIEDFKQVALGLIGERRDGEVVDQEQVHFGQRAQEGGAALEGMSAGEFIEEPRQAEAADVVVHTAGGMRERGAEEGLADAGGTGDEDVQVPADPAQVAHAAKQGGIEVAGR